jgi:GT2 family glycosyltransferase
MRRVPAPSPPLSTPAPEAKTMETQPGVVVIGRNEGDRLRGCLASLVGRADLIVYVDSGSTDQSVAAARAVGAEVVELPKGEPFTAAKARNAGLARLMALRPDQAYVQFVDGDCRVSHGWVEAAAAELNERPELAAVCGRRREVSPEASVYNLLCDLEWDTPIGEARSCGGDAMMRTAALGQVGGFDPAVIAGEEPDLCVRLRAKGWKVLRIDAEMTLHDAAMTRFGQWWKRSVRAGHAYAEGAARHGRPPERHCVRDVRSILLWGGALPAAAILAAWPTFGLSIAGLGLLYGAQGWRIARRQRRNGRGGRAARAYALFTVLGKFPQFQGVSWFWLNRVRGRRTAIIEYKGGPSPAPQDRAPTEEVSKEGALR